MSKQNSFTSAMGNVTYTNNGAVTNKSSLSSIVDFFYFGASSRGQERNKVVPFFKNAFNENPEIALRTAFYIRDIRGGQGERQAFRYMLEEMPKLDAKWVIENMHLIPEYGRWDDLFCLTKDDTMKSYVFNYIKKQLDVDLENMKQSKPISLLAKWMPSISTKKSDNRTFMHEYRKYFNIFPKTYRQMLSKMRKYIDIVESYIVAQTYESIKYECVPSRANLKYKHLFKKYDAKRYDLFLKSVEKGDTKINASTLYPADILNKYRGNGYYGIFKNTEKDDTLENLWKALPDYVSDVNGITVVDVSDSMFSSCSTISPIDVSTSLGIYIAERNKSEVFNNKCITFSEKPIYIEFNKKDSLIEKIRTIYRNNNGLSTDIQAVFDLILDTCKRNEVSQEDMPKCLFIISDMEFDNPSVGGKGTNFKIINEKYKNSGYKMPVLVFWNVNSNNKQTPVTVNDKGVILVSGYSPSIMKHALAMETKSAYEMVLEVVNSERYQDIVYK